MRLDLTEGLSACALYLWFVLHFSQYFDLHQSLQSVCVTQMNDPRNSMTMDDKNQETSTDSVQNDTGASSKGCSMTLLNNVMDKTVKQFIEKLR